MSEVLDAWVHHFGWLWMLVGLAGCVVMVVIFDD